MILLHKLPKTKYKSRRRVGRGNGSGLGKNCGYGHKGQIKRSGKSPITFEGGQKTLAKRVPKYKGFGFNPRTKRQVAILTLSAIDKAYAENEELSFETLREKGLINSKIKKIKIIGTGNLSKKVSFVQNENIQLTKSVSKVLA